MNGSKDVYFGMLVSDIGTYENHSQDLTLKTTRNKRTVNAVCNGNISDEEKGGSRDAPTIVGHHKLSNEDNFKLICMENGMERLLTWFHDTVVVARNAIRRLMI